MKRFAFAVFSATVGIVSIALPSFATDKPPYEGKSSSGDTLGAFRPTTLRGSLGSSPLLTNGPIHNLGKPHPKVYDIWSLTMEPGGSAEVVYGGTGMGRGSYGQFFSYDPGEQSFTHEDSIYGENIRSLVTRYDSIYGGTMVEFQGGSQSTGGRLFGFHSGDASINMIGVAISGDSTVEALAYGCGTLDSAWIFGGTGPYALNPSRPGGGHLFKYVPATGFTNLGTKVEGQKIIRRLACVRNAGIGHLVGGTGPDSAYVFSDCGGDCEQEHPDVVGPTQYGPEPWVGGLCRVKNDTVYGATVDSTWVFGYRRSNELWQEGHLFDPDAGEVPVGAGPMVKRDDVEDSLVYIAATIQHDDKDEPRLYEWNRYGLEWKPGPADGIENYNPRFWVSPVDKVVRFRSLAVDSSDSHLVYIGTTVIYTDTAYLLVFNPNEAQTRRSKLSAAGCTISDALQREPILECHPNPSRESVWIGYRLPRGFTAPTKLCVYDNAGRLLKTLVDADTRPSSEITVWDGRDGHGQSVGSGVYFCRLTFGSRSKCSKLVLIP